MLTDQPDLLSWRAAPTTAGPRTAASDGERVKATSRERWDAFAAANEVVAAWILAVARAEVDFALAEGRKPRVSAKLLTERARAFFQVSVNNSATAGMGEWLAEHEDLRPYVERRERR